MNEQGEELKKESFSDDSNFTIGLLSAENFTLKQKVEQLEGERLARKLLSVENFTLKQKIEELERERVARESDERERIEWAEVTAQSNYEHAKNMETLTKSLLDGARKKSSCLLATLQRAKETKEKKPKIRLNYAL